jgi:hypothetical protein
MAKHTLKNYLNNYLAAAIFGFALIVTFPIQSYAAVDSGGGSVVNTLTKTTITVKVAKSIYDTYTPSISIDYVCKDDPRVVVTNACPKSGSFTYEIPKTATSSTYATYSKKIDRTGLATQLPATKWTLWVYATKGDLIRGEKVYWSIEPVLEASTTNITLNKEGDFSGSVKGKTQTNFAGNTTAPGTASGSGGSNSGATTPAGSSSSGSGSTADAAKKTGPFGMTLSGTGIPFIALDKTACPTGSTVYTSGILKGVPCEGAIQTLPQVMLLVRNVIQGFLLPLVGTIFIIMLLVGGILYISSRGNQAQADKAKKTLTAAIIGLLIVVLSYTIIAIFAGAIGGSII